MSRARAKTKGKLHRAIVGLFFVFASILLAGSAYMFNGSDVVILGGVGLFIIGLGIIGSVETWLNAIMALLNS